MLSAALPWLAKFHIGSFTYGLIKVTEIGSVVSDTTRGLAPKGLKIVDIRGRTDRTYHHWAHCAVTMEITANQLHL